MHRHLAVRTFLAILPSFSGGGAERVTVNILNALAASGVSTGLVAINAHGPLSTSLVPAIPVANLGQDSLRRSLWALVREIRRQRPMVVYSTLGYINVALLGLRHFMPPETQIWIREANLPSISLPNNPYPRLMRWAYRLLYPRADRVIATSARMRAELVDEFSVRERQVKLLCNPVDETTIRQVAGRQIPRRNRARRFVAAGRLTGQKGYDRLLELFAANAGQDVELLIAGEGPEFSQLERQVVVLGLEAKVRLLGFVEQPWPLIAGADALLLPSRWEGMPNIALEALACGTPVIATPESGGITELMSQAPTGAVTVAEFGPRFAAAMQVVPPNMGGIMRPSLLPPQYRLESVVCVIREWIAGND